MDLGLSGKKVIMNGGSGGLGIETLKNFAAEGCDIAYSIDEMKEMVKDEEEVFIIGGGTIYKLFYPIVDKLYLTIAHTKVEADTYFPTIDYKDWIETSREDIPVGEKCDFGFSFVNYDRK